MTTCNFSLTLIFNICFETSNLHLKTINVFHASSKSLQWIVTYNKFHGSKSSPHSSPTKPEQWFLVYAKYLQHTQKPPHFHFGHFFPKCLKSGQNVFVAMSKASQLHRLNSKFKWLWTNDLWGWMSTKWMAKMEGGKVEKSTRYLFTKFHINIISMKISNWKPNIILSSWNSGGHCQCYWYSDSCTFELWTRTFGVKCVRFSFRWIISYITCTRMY